MKIPKELVEKDKIRRKMKLVFQEMKQKDIIVQELQQELLKVKAVDDLGVKFDDRNLEQIEKIKINRKMEPCLEKIKQRRRTPRRWLQ